MEILEKHKCFDGVLTVCQHQSDVLKCPMKFSVFMPPILMNRGLNSKIPFITFLSGLTCTHDNFTTKSGAYSFAAQNGLAIIAPDTSPRGEDVADADTYDLGQGASFYINAAQEPWAKHYQMESYITNELNDLVCEHYALMKNNQGICGHSMGGHGALTLGLKYPDRYRSISAFAPIVAPTQVEWGQKIFNAYLGDGRDKWLEHDACELMMKSRDRSSYQPILIHQGSADEYLEDHLKPYLFVNACEKVGQKIKFHMCHGYDHGYYFVQSYIKHHVEHHAQIMYGNMLR